MRRRHVAINAETVSAVVGAVGLSTIVAAAINAISNRKKTGADATKVITDAALGVVTQLQSRIKDLLAEVSDLKSREDDRDRREDAARRALLRHHQWDLRLADIINHSLPDHAHLLPPPPLFAEEDWLTDPPQKKPPEKEAAT
jgi:hypothetical protein